MPTLVSLPREIQLMIIQLIDPKTLFRFIQTCETIHAIGKPELYKISDEEKLEIFNWSLDNEDDRWSTTELLIEDIRKIYSKDKEFGIRALRAACEKSHAQAIFHLGLDSDITSGEDPNFHPIIEAAKGKDLFAAAETVWMLIFRGAKNLDCVDGEGMTALHWAAARGNTNAMRHLTNNGANRTIRSKAGRTPILSAAAAGAYAGVQDMYFSGNDANDCDNSGASVLILATPRANFFLIQMLVEVVKVDIDHADNTGRTALFYAAEGGRGRCVKTLVDAGCKVRLRDNFGKEPRDYCTTEKNGAKIGKIITSSRRWIPGLR